MIPFAKSLASLAALALATTSIVHAGDETKHPNILLILADDLGYGDLGAFGCKDIPTPNIDSLAKDGVRFTQAYAYNVCSPTRASLLSGRYAERVGIRTVLMGQNAKGFTGTVTLPKVLKDAGYTTGLVGKWHLGYTGDVRPTRMGFDEFFGILGGKTDYFKHTDSTQKNGTPEGKHDLWEGEKEVFLDGYSTDLFTARATKFIRDHAKQPFFLELAYNAPHYSSKKGDFQAPESYLKKFGITGDPNGTRGGYAAMVNAMDDGIGRVLAELKAQNLDDNTLVIFSSDNGSELVGSNKPFSGGKHSAKEGGVRVPWMARLPKTIPAGRVSNDVVHVMDLMPTLLSIAGVKAPDDVKFDGIDIRSAFTGAAAIPSRALYLPPNAIRDGKWKLIAGKLYDLDKDPAEKTDLAKAHPDEVTRLTAAFTAMQSDLKVPKAKKDKDKPKDEPKPDKED